MGLTKNHCLIISHLDALGKKLGTTYLYKYPNKFDIQKKYLFQTTLRFNIEFFFGQQSLFHTIIYPWGLTDKGLNILQSLVHCRISNLCRKSINTLISFI